MNPTKSAKANLKIKPTSAPCVAGRGERVVAFLTNQTIFTQGDTNGTVFYIQKGRVKLTVTSMFGKEATLEMLGKGEFFGDSGLAGHPLRLNSATAMGDCKLLQIENSALKLAFQSDRNLNDQFIMHLILRNIRYQSDLVDQLFDTCERRVARILLLLANFGNEVAPRAVIPKVGLASLAAMAGTSPMRARSFMKKFQKSGFIGLTSDGMEVHSSLLSVVLAG
jgi:CRP/FNR family cyclic AMP-dependent transcriptional regulator